jgi:hypothetical protein
MKRSSIIAALMSTGVVMLCSCGLTPEQIANRNRRDAAACNAGYTASCIDYAHETQPPIIVNDGSEAQREIDAMFPKRRNNE